MTTGEGRAVRKRPRKNSPERGRKLRTEFFGLDTNA
jgi:hypothetical protein